MSQAQKDKYYIIPFIGVTYNGQIHKGRKQNGTFQEFGEEGNEELLLNGYWILVLQNEKSFCDGWWWGTYSQYS